MPRIYLDAVSIIYLVENVEPYVQTVIDRLNKPGTIQLCSELTRLECRVKPLRDGKEALLTAFDSYFTNIIHTVIPLSRQTLDQATKLRADYGFKTPDAIHLAAAITAKCDIFLTNDYQLHKCNEIKVEIVAPKE